jgi:hypothetical protein
MGVQRAARHSCARTLPRADPNTEQAVPSPCEPRDSEFSWGPGLVAPQYNGNLPSEGGIYMPKCPPVHENGVQKPIPPRQARGHPGEKITGR